MSKESLFIWHAASNGGHTFEIGLLEGAVLARTSVDTAAVAPWYGSARAVAMYRILGGGVSIV